MQVMETLHETTTQDEVQNALPPPDGPAFTPMQGWVYKLSSRQLRWNKRWLTITDQRVELSRNRDKVESKGMRLQGLVYDELQSRPKVRWWLRSRLAFAFELIPSKGSTSGDTGPWIISVGSEWELNAWMTSLEGATSLATST